MSGKPKKKRRALASINVLPVDDAALPVNEIQAPGWGIFVVLAATALIYARAIYNGFTDMDDDSYILKNPFLKHLNFHEIKAIFTSFYASNYHPLTTVSFLLDHRFFGVNPTPYHIENVILHLINTWLVYLLALRLSTRNLIALIVATLFALHPMHVESVAWVSERKDLLYALFYISSLIFYLKYTSSALHKKDYMFTLVLFIAALLSKLAAVTLPLMLVAIDVYRGRGINAKSLMEKIPFFILSIVFGVLNLFAQKAGGPVLFLFSSYGVIKGIFLFTSGLAAYFYFLVAPFPLTAIHYFPTITNGVLPYFYYASLPALLVIGWLAARRSAYRKEILFGVAFFLISMSVMLQVVSVGNAYMAERYSYVGYIGLFYIIAQFFVALYVRHKVAALSTLGLLIVMYSGLTEARIGVWKNTETLFTDVINKNPGITDLNYVYMLRGDFRANNGDVEGALADHTKAIEMNPSFKFEDKAYLDRAHDYDLKGDIKSAVSDYTNSLNLNPENAVALNARGWDNFQMKDLNAAFEDFNAAIARKPDLAEAYNNRGWLYFKVGNINSAFNDFSKAITLMPDFVRPYFNRAQIRENAGDWSGVVADYDSVQKRSPDNPYIYYKLGVAYLNLNQSDSACMKLKMADMLGNRDAGELIRRFCQ